VALGTGGASDLERAIRAHANLIEYVPLSLLLLACFELNGGNLALLNVCALMLVLGRCVHAWSILTASPTARVVGMGLTFTCWGTIAPANIWLLL
jgi:hypothetical protein